MVHYCCLFLRERAHAVYVYTNDRLDSRYPGARTGWGSPIAEQEADYPHSLTSRFGNSC